MVTFYSGATEARNVEHNNYKFGLDKTLSILFKSAEVSVLGSPLFNWFWTWVCRSRGACSEERVPRELCAKGQSWERFGVLGGFFCGLFLCRASQNPSAQQLPHRIVISVTDSEMSLKFSYLVPAFLQHSFFQRKIRQDQEKNMR